MIFFNKYNLITLFFMSYKTVVILKYEDGINTPRKHFNNFNGIGRNKDNKTQFYETLF